MATEPTTQDVNATQSATEPKPAAGTFTQDDVNRIVANRVAKYSDYEDLKAKAAKFDAAEEANKTELQKVQEKADSLQQRLDAMEKADKIRAVRDEVSKETGVPASLLTWETTEDCTAQAQAIIAYAKPGYPQVKDGGEPQVTIKKETRDQFSDWAKNMFQGG